jgi:predicted small integral membrane protein
MTARVTKMLLSLTLAAFALVVAYDNLVDYGSNFAFVQHVLSMDTTFRENALLDRAITRPWMWHVGYLLIIAGEAATGILLLFGSAVLWRARRQPASTFQAAKRWVVAGCGLGFVVWFFGFMVVGGEWFAMWQSKAWNGQEGAFRFYMAVIGVLVFVNQADGELGGEHRR